MRRLTGVHGRYSVAEAAVNRGGVGAIFPTADAALVYKEYLSPDGAPSVENLRRLVEIGRNVLVEQRKAPGETPESSVNWPVDVVLANHGRRPRGVLLPAIPSSLLNEFGQPRGLEFLILARTSPPPAKGRVVLLLRMAEIQAYIDALGLVHGDINAKNLAWTLQPQPIMYLIDCDGMVPQSPPPQAGVHAMGWVDPRVADKLVPAPDHLSDRYALALAMYRGLLLVSGHLRRLADGTWQAPSQIPSTLHPRIRDLLRRALGQPLVGELRPTPAEWVEGLVDAFLPNGFDEAALAALDAAADQRRRAIAARHGPTGRFRPIPKTEWHKVAAPPSGPTTGTQTSTTWAPPGSKPPPPAQPRPAPPPPRQPPSRPPPRPWAHPPQPATGGFDIGRLRRPGRWALRRGRRWHLACLVLTCCYYASLLLTVPSYVQLRRAGAKATAEGRAAMRACLAWAILPGLAVGVAYAVAPQLSRRPVACPSLLKPPSLQVGRRAVIRVRGTPGTRVLLVATGGLRRRAVIGAGGVARFTVRPRRRGHGTLRAPGLGCASLRVTIHPRRSAQSHRQSRAA